MTEIVQLMQQLQRLFSDSNGNITVTSSGDDTELHDVMELSTATGSSSTSTLLSLPTPNPQQVSTMSLCCV